MSHLLLSVEELADLFGYLEKNDRDWTFRIVRRSDGIRFLVSYDPRGFVDGIVGSIGRDTKSGRLYVDSESARLVRYGSIGDYRVETRIERIGTFGIRVQRVDPASGEHGYIYAWEDLR